VHFCSVQVCKQYSAFRLLGIGMGVWALACYCCGLAPNFATLMICRMFVGVGEASFVALAAPFIGGGTIRYQLIIASPGACQQLSLVVKVFD
jgi:MFS family permease